MNGIHGYLLAILMAMVLTPLLLLGWAVVQGLRRRQIPNDQSDPYGDVLAGRGGCGPCGCTTSCRQTSCRQKGDPR